MSEKPDTVPGNSHRNPVPVGVMIKTTVERGDPYMKPKLYNVEITILNIVRGKKALERANSEGILNDPPEPGNEYVLTLIRFGYLRRQRGTNDTFKLKEGQFAAASADNGYEYEIPLVLRQPQPQLIDWVFNPDESREGWIVLEVPEEDEQPLLIFKRERADGVYGIWGNLWFQLY